MSDAILASLTDRIMYWAPGTISSTGAREYELPSTVSQVRIDPTVDKEIRDLIEGRRVKMTVWSKQPLLEGGWLCQLSDFANAPTSYYQTPELISGAVQIVHTGTASSYDKTRKFYMAVA